MMLLAAQAVAPCGMLSVDLFPRAARGPHRFVPHSLDDAPAARQAQPRESRIAVRGDLYAGVRGSESAVRRFWAKSRYLKRDAAALEEALIFASAAHSGQRRKSGEPYIVHPVETATILAELRMDTDTLIAGLLHDTIEDTDVSLGDIDRRFGQSVAAIVEGVTDGPKACDDANQRELLLAMSTDWRIVLVKLADRLHNMRTLGSMPRAKQVRKAEETMAMFVPLAKELGIHQVEAELEVRCAQTLFPQLFSPLVALNRFAVDAKPLLSLLRHAARLECPAQLQTTLKQDEMLSSYDAARRISGHRQRWAEHLDRNGMLSDSV